MLDVRTGEIASRAFDFGETHVGSVMVPRRQIPQAGERFEVGKGVVIEVLEVTPRRVKTVRVRRRAGADDAAESRAEAR